MKRSLLRLLLAVAFLALSSSLAAAQAWVNPKGELYLTLRSDFQTSTGVWHGSTLISSINGSPNLAVDAFNDAISAEYVPIEHLAIGLTLNGNDVAYKGPQAIPGVDIAFNHGRDDDGSFHANITDLDFEARYQLYDQAFTFTPVFRTRVPVTDYENRGYAAAGSHLAEASLGFYIGKYGLGLEDLVLQASYVFTYVQKDNDDPTVQQYRVNRSDADLAISYIFSSKWIAGIGAAFRYTHDGFDLVNYVNLDPTVAADANLIKDHDAVLKAEYFAPAAFATYQFTPKWGLNLHIADIVWGRSVSNALSTGLTLAYTNNLLD
jgi:hypothetical protein